MSLSYSLTALRIAVALIFVSHGVQRSLIYKTVDQFGVFLDSKGFIVGFYLAWLITLFELAGGTLLAVGRWSRYISLAFIFHQLMGIALVHAKNGWFVVGAGTGGMEYSVLLIFALAVIFSASSPKRISTGG
jgi:putative oxidoreductase